MLNTFAHSEPTNCFRKCQRIIYEATGVANIDQLVAIEDVMRMDVFHSGLESKSRAELTQGAIEAYEILMRAP